MLLWSPKRENFLIIVGNRTTLVARVATKNALSNPFAFVVRIMNKGSKTAPKTAKLPTVPIVLKDEVLAKSKGNINLPKSCKIPKSITKKLDKANKDISLKTSLVLNKLVIRKYNKTKESRVIRLAEVICGQPQKLP